MEYVIKCLVVRHLKYNRRKYNSKRDNNYPGGSLLPFLIFCDSFGAGVDSDGIWIKALSSALVALNTMVFCIDSMTK